MWDKQKRITNVFLIFGICISILGLSIGYAAVNSTTLNIIGEAVAKQYEGMYILDATYSDSSNADLEMSEICEYVGTMLHTDIYLSETDVNSYIEYKLTIYNNSDFSKYFKGISYADDFYSNSDITYELTGLKIGDYLLVGESQTFTIRFYYDTTTVIDNNLDSYLNFDYDYYYEEVADYDILITTTEPYPFPGVTNETPVALADIANIHFVVANGLEEPIKAIVVELVYTTTTGSKQSGKIDLMNSSGSVIGTTTMEFQGKQTLGTATVQFDNLSLTYGEKLSVQMDVNSITNGHVEISGVTISAVF